MKRAPMLRILSCVVLSALILLSAGCGGEPVGTVSGTVTFQGKPLSDATITFYSAETGSASEAKLDSQGAFEMPANLPVGTYKVFLQPPPPQQLPPGTPQPKQPAFDLPPMYQDAGQTPLAETVQAGPNKFSISIPE